VDDVTIFDDPSPLPVSEQMSPDILGKGGHYALDQIVGRAEVGAAGCATCLSWFKRRKPTNIQLNSICD